MQIEKRCKQALSRRHLASEINRCWDRQVHLVHVLREFNVFEHRTIKLRYASN